MFIKPLRRGVDLVGDKAANHIVNEKHPLTRYADRIFVPNYGPFFRNSVKVSEIGTGAILVLEEDYKLLYNVEAATTATAEEINCCIYVTKKDSVGVIIEYQAVGGKYERLSTVYKALIDNYKNHPVGTVNFIDIINLPEVYPVVPHKHQLWDLEDLDPLISALDSVINAIYSKDFEKFEAIYTYLEDKTSELEAYLASNVATLTAAINTEVTRSGFFLKEFYITVDNTDPNSFNDGNWVRLTDSLLIGKMLGDTSNGVVDIASAIGYDAYKLNIWQLNSFNAKATYTLTSNKTTVNEGSTVRFTLTTTNLLTGTLVPYNITGLLNSVSLAGISKDDVVGGAASMSGNFVIDSSGVGFIDVTLTADGLREGTEYLKLYLNDFTTISRTVAINDTSNGESYEIYASSDMSGKNRITRVNEGQDFYIRMNTVNVADNIWFNLFYENSTVTNADFMDSLPPMVLHRDNHGWVNVKVKADQLTEGLETLVFGISKSNYENVIVSNTISIVDTSKTPTYEMYFSSDAQGKNHISSADEDTTVFIVIKTGEVVEGTVFSLAYSGTSNSADLTGMPTTVTVGPNDMAVAAINIKGDELSEGAETLSIAALLYGSRIAGADLVINDSSRSLVLSAAFATSSFGTRTVSQANEGDSVYLIIETSNVADGTVFDVSYDGVTANADFDEDRPTSVTIYANRAVIKYTLAGDITTEGQETFIVTITSRINRENTASVSLIIMDTSVDPTFNIGFSANEDGVGTITTVNEGNVCYAVILTSNVADGTVLYLQTTIADKLATINNGDIVEAIPTSVVINNNKGIVRIALRNDEDNEGDEALLMKVSRTLAGTPVASNTLTIKDTSQRATYAAKFTADAAGINIVGSAVIGTTVYLQIETANVPDYTVLYVNYGELSIGNNPLANDAPDSAFSQPRTGVTKVMNNRATVPYTIATNIVSATDYSFRGTVSRSASTGTYVATAKMNILVPKYTIQFTDMSGAVISSIREGQTFKLAVNSPNMPPSLTVDLSYQLPDSQTAYEADVVVAPTTMNIVNGVGSYTYTAKKDDTIEPNEVFTVSAKLNGQILGTAVVLIIDDRMDTKVFAKFIPNATSQNTVTANNMVLSEFITTTSAANSITSSLPHGFEYLDVAKMFVCPEQVHSGWSIDAVPTGNSPSVLVNVWDIPAQGHDEIKYNRTLYTGNLNVVAIKPVVGPNLFSTNTGTDPTTYGVNTSGFPTFCRAATVFVKGAPLVITRQATHGRPLVLPPMDSQFRNRIIVCPYGEHTSWTITRTVNAITVNIIKHDPLTGQVIPYVGFVSYIIYDQDQGYSKSSLEHIGYPKVVKADSCSGYFKITQDLLVTPTEVFDFRDSKFVIAVTPETPHDHWTLVRSKDGILLTVFNRGGVGGAAVMDPTAVVNYVILQVRE